MSYGIGLWPHGRVGYGMHACMGFTDRYTWYGQVFGHGYGAACMFIFGDY